MDASAPGDFAANRLALWGPSIRAERVVRWPWPDETGIPIHEDDVAAVGEDIRFEAVTREEALRLLRRQGGWAAVNVPFLLGFEGFSEGFEYPDLTEEELAQMQPLATVEQVTGRPARTFAQWARDHARDFGALSPSGA
jgi:hypothetical protein